MIPKVMTLSSKHHRSVSALARPGSRFRRWTGHESVVAGVHRETTRTAASGGARPPPPPSWATLRPDGEGVQHRSRTRTQLSMLFTKPFSWHVGRYSHLDGNWMFLICTAPGFMLFAWAGLRQFFGVREQAGLPTASSHKISRHNSFPKLVFDHKTSRIEQL